MRLDRAGTSIANATEADLINALPPSLLPADWSLNLVKDEGNWLALAANEKGDISVAYAAGNKIHEPAPTLAVKEARSLCMLYFKGDANWQSRLPGPAPSRAFQDFRNEQQGGRAGARFESRPRVSWLRYATTTVPLLLLVGFGWYAIGGDGVLNHYLPWLGQMEALPMLIPAVAVGLVLMLAIAGLVYSAMQRSKVAGWKPVNARIVRSETSYRAEQVMPDEAAKNIRQAVIEYEYEIGGRSYRSSRVTVSALIEQHDVERVLRSYPEGQQVTAYYDPKNPQDAVIEREPPRSIMLSLVRWLALAIVAFAAYAWYVGLATAMSPLTTAFPNAFWPVVFFGLVFGLLFLAGSLASLWQYRRFAAYATTTGKVVTTDIVPFTRFKGRNTGLFNRNTGNQYDTLFMPVVEYSFVVAGRDYLSRQIRPSGDISGPKDYVQTWLKRYAKGTSISVYYDKSDPLQSALEGGTRLGWLLLIPAIIGLGAAWFGLGS